MIDLSKMKKVQKAADFYVAIGVPIDADFEEVAAAMADYCDLSYSMFKINGKTFETIGIDKVRRKDFPGFSGAAMSNADDACGDPMTAFNQIDDLIWADGTNELFYTREQIKDHCGVTDKDIDNYIDETGRDFEECQGIYDEKEDAYHMLTDAELAKVDKIGEECASLWNDLNDSIEDALDEGGPENVLKVLDKNIKDIKIKLAAYAVRVKNAWGAWPETVEVM